MKTLNRYHIPDTHTFVINNPYASRVFVIRDQETTEERLVHLFRDSHTIFKARIQKLGSVSKATTKDDADSLRIMLETLIQTKCLLQSSK